MCVCVCVVFSYVMALIYHDTNSFSDATHSSASRVSMCEIYACETHEASGPAFVNVHSVAAQNSWLSHGSRPAGFILWAQKSLKKWSKKVFESTCININIKRLRKSRKST